MWIRLLIVSLLCSAVPLANGDFKPLTDAELWGDSGLDLAFATALINERDCASSPLYRKACDAAIDKGRDLLKLTALPTESFEAALAELTRQAGARVPVELLLAKMISAQLQVFDPLARLESAASLRQASAMAQMSFGAGLTMAETSDGVVVLDVRPRSAADRAGILVGDRIRSLNGRSLRAFGDFLGRPKTKMKLRVLTPGQSERTVRLELESLVRDHFEQSTLENDGLQITVFRLSSIPEGLCARLEQRLSRTEPDAVILDLRQNGGGVLAEGECVARLFLGAGAQILNREELNLPLPVALKSRMVETRARGSVAPVPTKSFLNIPLVILTDALTASAAEVIAGAVQEHERGWIVGGRSFGKGTVQKVRAVTGYPRLFVAHSVGKFQRALSRTQIHRYGIRPNFKVARNARFAGLSYRRERDYYPDYAVQDSAEWTETRLEESWRLGQCAKAAPMSSDDHPLAFATRLVGCQIALRPKT